MTEITLHPPRVEGNRVHFSWSPATGLFLEDGYYAEYPDLTTVDASAGKLAEAYFPVCLALATLGHVRFRLPAKIDPAVLTVWKDVIDATASRLYRREVRVEFVCEPVEPGYKKVGSSSALFFGGGVESLLVLGRLLDQGTRPVLVSLAGGNWPGSDPETNPDKFAMDRRVSSELGLKLFRVYTDFREKFRFDAWDALMLPGFSVMNSVVALPSFIALLLPAVESLGLGKVVSGNEMTDYDEEYFCFSPKMTDRLTLPAWNVEYTSQLGELLKEDVCHDLYRHFPYLTKYQYSCWRNLGERWCMACSKCMQYYMLLRNNGIEPAAAGMDSAVARRNMNRLIWAVAKSAEGRKGEIWERICRFPRLRSQEDTRRILDTIRRRAFLWHHFVTPVYNAIPWQVRSFLRPLKQAALSARRVATEPRINLRLQSAPSRT